MSERLRYEHIEWHLSTATCAALLHLLAVDSGPKIPWGFHENAIVNAELWNIVNELRARVQRTDVDPHARQEQRTDNSDLA